MAYKKKTVRYKTVIVINSPVTERYVRRGMQGKIDTLNNQIQVNGCWWELTDQWETKELEFDICPSRDNAQPHLFENGQCTLCYSPLC